MNTKYTIKNFRVFDEDGVSIELKPLTILTGCNSSGKSSIVKSLLLLCDYFSSLKQDKENGKKVVLTAHDLDFSKKPHNRLGKFSKVVNTKAEEKDVTFEIQVHSLMLGQDVNVELVFFDNGNNFNGIISSIAVKKMDGTIIYSSKANVGSVGNLYSILPEFIRFTYTQFLIGYYQSVKISREFNFDDEEVMPDDKYNELVETLKTHLADFKVTYGRTALIDINRWNNGHRDGQTFLQKYTGGNPEMIEKVRETGILYYLPIFDKMLHGNKTECVEFLTQSINEDKIDNATKFVVNKILADFMDSSCESFLAYYRMWEENFLSDVRLSSFPSTGNAPKLFNDGIMRHVNKIVCAPHNIGEDMEVNLFGEGSNEDKPRKSEEERIAEWEAQTTLTFSLMYEALAYLSMKYVPNNSVYYNEPTMYANMEFSSRTERLFIHFVKEVIEEIVVDAAPEALQYVSSSIINVQRLYPVEADNEFTELLKRYLKAKRNMPQNTDYIPDTFMNRWVEKFKIGKRISINVDSEGLGITLKLHKDDNDQAGSLLADSGYGITQLFATFLNIEVAIMERKVSKVLADDDINAIPSEEDKITKYSVPTIAIEEPEIHLHPSYQSMLADMFYEAYSKYGVHFIIETHSEYMIRKFQLLVAGVEKVERLNNEDISVFYVYTPEEAEQTGEPQVKPIGICSDGYLNDSFGSGFFDESTSLSKQLM